MQSINDQKNAIQKIVKEKGLKIHKTFAESKSAKEPGRKEFNKLIDTIYTHGKIKGIVCWSINRLTRNPVDTGTIQWLLQKGDIQEIVTPTKTYTEIDSDFIIAIEGAQANRFIRDLKRDTLRGVKSKLEKGIAPLLAPVGYKNNTYKKQGKRDISPHKTYFPLLRQIFDLALTGNYSVVALKRKAQKFGIRTNRHRKLISRTQMYKTLVNPFYTGKFLYSGEIYQGKHKPMITDNEHERIRSILNDRSRPRKIKHDLLTGLIRCGECGMMVTGEAHTKTYKNGKSQTFTYYRCTKQNKKIKCGQPYISDTDLEEQMVEWLGSINISTKFINWAIKQLNETNENEIKLRKNRLKSAEKELRNIMIKLDNLVKLKISENNKEGDLLSDHEFLDQKKYLTKEKTEAQELIDEISKRQDDWIERAEQCFNFASKAQLAFKNGTIEQKKLIMKSIGSNLILKDKILEIEPQSVFKTLKKGVDAKLIRLEPEEKADTSDYYTDFSLPNYLWGG